MKPQGSFRCRRGREAEASEPGASPGGMGGVHKPGNADSLTDQERAETRILPCSLLQAAQAW